MSLFSSLFGGNSIKRQPRRDRINVVAQYDCLLDGEFYVMILDFVYDRTLIDRIKQKRFSKSEIKSEFIRRGDRINGSLIEYMDKLVPCLNKEDLYISVDADMGDPYEVTSGFFFT